MAKKKQIQNSEAAVPEFKFQMIELEKINPNPKNPRVIKDKDFLKMKKSIQDFPKMLFIRPIVVDKDMIVIGGNQRFQAVTDLREKFAYYPMVPVCFADDLTEDEREQFIIKDNTNFGGWNYEQLATSWDTAKLDVWGLKGVPSMNADPKVKDDEFDIDEETFKNIKTDIQIGDVFQIGPHRLMCGDSVNEDHVKTLMDGKTAELLFTSPPYSDIRDYGGNKNLNVDYISEFIVKFAPYVKYQAVNLGFKRKDHQIIPYWDTYIFKATTAGYLHLAWNVWARSSSGQVGNQSAFIPITHEFIFVFGRKFKHINRTVEKKTIDRIDKLKRSNKKGPVKGRRQKDGSIKDSSVGISVSMKEMESVFYSNAELGPIRKMHPATFPIELPSEYIKSITDPNDIIVDSFSGAGTTLCASHQLNRICYAMELEPVWCQVAIDRILKLDPTLKVQKYTDVSLK